MREFYIERANEINDQFVRLYVKRSSRPAERYQGYAPLEQFLDGAVNVFEEHYGASAISMELFDVMPAQECRDIESIEQYLVGFNEHSIVPDDTFTSILECASRLLLKTREIAYSSGHRLHHPAYVQAESLLKLKPENRAITLDAARADFTSSEKLS